MEIIKKIAQTSLEELHIIGYWILLDIQEDDFPPASNRENITRPLQRVGTPVTHVRNKNLG